MDYSKFITGDHTQRQDPLSNQLSDLIPVAEKLGLHDAANFLKTFTNGLFDMVKKDALVWYVDFETGEIEQGKICNVQYKDGKLNSFSVEFENGDFDEFYGKAYGSTFFPSEDHAKAALLRGDPTKSAL